MNTLRRLLFLTLTLCPSVLLAQTSGASGEVKDTTGAAVPGVTVEVASPALLEKVRSVVTDSSGLYKIVDRGENANLSVSIVSAALGADTCLQTRNAQIIRIESLD
jgi:hypothetical protein